MSLLRALSRRPFPVTCIRCRSFHAMQPRWAPPPAAKPVKEQTAPEAAAAEQPKLVKSSCQEGTVLEGVQWLKGQPPIQALPDNDYPEWLWTILEPKVFDDEGVPGGKAEKVRLRKINRQRIREQNFMKSH